MTYQTIRLLLSAASLMGGFVVSAPALAAGSDGPRFDAEIAIGGEYDSNVSVDAVDTTTGSGDVAALLDVDLGFRTSVARETDWRVGYSFSQSLHQDFDDFDLQSHIVSSDLSHDFGAITVGGAYRYIDTRLGGDRFLEMNQLSPYFTAMLTKKVMLRGDYTYTDKEFVNRSDRDAKNRAGSLDLYYFINGSKTVLLAGYKYADENAQAAQFDYKAHNFRLRMTQKFALGSEDATLRLGWRYEKRDYSGITPSIAAKRDDRKHRLQAELEVPISKIFFVGAEYEYADYKSNLPSADYRQNVASLKVGARF